MPQIRNAEQQNSMIIEKLYFLDFLKETYLYNIQLILMRQVILLLWLIFITEQIPEICKSANLNLNLDNDDLIDSQGEKVKQCFSYLIEKGQYQSIDALEQSLNDEQQKIMQNLMIQQIKRLEAISQYVILAKTTCEPILKWAQNLTHVFVAAKLSHRWDSPPCLKSIEQKYQISNNTLLFKNLCLVSNSQINFFFQEKLYNQTKGVLQAKKDGVGTYSLTFEKSEPRLWLYLFQRGQKVPMWHEIMSRNSTLKSEFEEMHKKIEVAGASSILSSSKNWQKIIWPGVLLSLLMGLLI